MRTVSAKQIVTATENAKLARCWATAEHGWNGIEAVGTIDYGQLIGTKTACQDCIDNHTAKTTPKVTIRFDTVDCPRCSGSGQYPSNVDGGRCFTCRGTKVVLSRNGRTARKAYDALIGEHCMIAVGDLQENDLVWHYNRPGFMDTRMGWVKVLSVTPDEFGSGRVVMKTTGQGFQCEPQTKIRISKPVITREIIGSIASRFKGATMVVDGIDQSPEIVKLIRKAVGFKF